MSVIRTLSAIGFYASCALLVGLSETHASGAVDDPCLAFTMPDKDALLNSKKTVFAFYFGDYFDLSRDNLPPDQDFYEKSWVVPAGQWVPYGGFLRTRPLSPHPGMVQAYRRSNFIREVRMAIARGVTGFAYEVGKLTCPQIGGAGCLSTLNEMLDAAAEVDARFKIMLVPDSHLGADGISTLVSAVSSRKNIYRIMDKVVVAPWWDTKSQYQSSYWNALKASQAAVGQPIYFMPIDTSLQLAVYGDAADGVGLFATALPDEGMRNSQFSATLASQGKAYMAGVTPQHYRPSNYIYWEPEASLSFRNGWMSALELSEKIDSVLLTTWNDFSETSQVAPFTDASNAHDIGTGFYNLNGYYASWFLTGIQPTVTHDVLYSFYKRQPVEAKAVMSPQATASAVAQAPGKDIIELLGFLKEPSTLSITVAGKTVSADVGAGVQSLKVPLSSGVPSFSLQRGGKQIINFSTKIPISGGNGQASGYADITYWTTSASTKGVCVLDIDKLN